MTASTDPRFELRRAFEQAALVVKGVTPGQLGQATPCSEFEVSDLLGHLVGVANRIASIGRGEIQPERAGDPGGGLPRGVEHAVRSGDVRGAHRMAR